jgi:hypothetical protein
LIDERKWGGEERRERGEVRREVRRGERYDYINTNFK